MNYTLAELAAELRCSRDFLSSLVARGLVPCYRVGRRSPRFTEEHRAQIEAFLEESSTEQRPASLTTARSRARRRAAS